MKTRAPVLLVSINPNNKDAFVDIGKNKDTLSPSTAACGSFDSHELTLPPSGTFESHDSATTTEKSKIHIFKLRTPERRKARRASVGSLAQSLPPVIAPTISFDDLGNDEPLKDSPGATLHAPERISKESKAAVADRRLSIFRAPLPLRKTLSSPLKKQHLSKSLTLPDAASLANELELSLVENKSYDQDFPKNTWFPIEKSRDLTKKGVRFSPDGNKVHLVHFDPSCVQDYFYSSAEIADMKSARYEDAALFRSQAKNAPSAVDDLDMSLRQKIVCVDSLLSIALNDPDENPSASIRGIEHFVYPELQQEMISKKKEVQAQVMSYVRSKRPDPQGWRLANHSRMHSQWARDVALEKGQAYAMKVDDEEDTKSLGLAAFKPPRRGARRASLCASTPSVGAGAAAASLARPTMKVDEEIKPCEDIKTFKPARRRRNRSASIFSSMPSSGLGAAAASLVKMEFFDTSNEDTKHANAEVQESKTNECSSDDAPSVNCEFGNEQSPYDEWREEYDEA